MLVGLAVCFTAALIATFAGGAQNFIGAPMLGLLLGAAIANLLPAGAGVRFKSGAGFCSKYLLKAGIILAGGTLSFRAILGAGLAALPLVIFNICLSFFAAWYIGRAMGVGEKIRVLVGGGTAICGGTAIAALTPIVDADEHEMAYAMTAIFLFDLFAALLWPYAARAMALTPEQYGILGGLAISDTSSVTAAGATFDAITGAAEAGMEGLSGGSLAVVVKLTRTVMLAVVSLAVLLIRSARDGSKEPAKPRGGSLALRALRTFPIFVLGFLGMAVLNTLVGFSGVMVFGLKLSKLLSVGYKLLITMALVGVGMKIKLRELFTDGRKPVLLGGCAWLAVALSTLCYVLFLM